MIRRLALSATTLALLTLALGCGGGKEGGEAPKTPPATTPSATPSTAPQAQQGGDDDEGAPLLAWADVDNDEGKAPLSVQFKADIEGGKPPLKIVWKFGDGTPDSSEANPKHTYDKAGKYRADLEVTDASGDNDSDYVEIEVQ